MTNTAEAVGVLLYDRGYEVEYNGIRADLLSAGRSPQFIDALLTIGLVSLHLSAPGILERIDPAKNAMTLTILTDYAIDVSHRLEAEPNVIDANAVMARAEEMKARFLDPELNPDLTRDVGVIAQLIIDGHLRLAPNPPENPRERALGLDNRGEGA